MYFSALQLELYIEQDEYIAELSDAAGVRVVIHNQTQMPFPEDEGFTISPGSQANMGLERVSIYLYLTLQEVTLSSSENPFAGIDL